MGLLQKIEGKLSLARKRDGDEILSRFKSVTEFLGDEADFRRADLSGAYLSKADLGGANLTGANLGGANLGGANLTGADLVRANLSGANLTGANLTGANLTGANLTGANLTGANLLEADLSGANLLGADLSGANLLGADLSGVIGLTPDQIRCARIDPSTKLPDESPFPARFRGAATGAGSGSTSVEVLGRQGRFPAVQEPWRAKYSTAPGTR